MKHLSPAAEWVFETLDGLSPAQLGIIEPLLLRWVRREYRLRRRDRAIIAASGLYFGRLASGRAIADELAKDLRRFRARSAPEQGKRAALGAILHLNRGRTIGAAQLRDILAGNRCRQSASQAAIIPR